MCDCGGTKEARNQSKVMKQERRWRFHGHVSISCGVFVKISLFSTQVLVSVVERFLHYSYPSFKCFYFSSFLEKKWFKLSILTGLI